MATQMPASQPAHRSSAAHADAGSSARRTTPLGRAAWWCLTAWPLLFLVCVVVAMVMYPEGQPRTASTGDDVLGFVAGALLVGAPLASLVLSTVDFRRTRARRALVPAWILLALVAAWDVAFAVQVADWSDVNWWVFTPTVVVVAALVAAIAWPAAEDRTTD